MDVRFLETFIVAAEQGSFAGAARHLGMTAAGVAQRVRALETLLDAPLLARSGREVRPTAAGLAILEHGRRIVSDSRDLKSLTAVDAGFGELRIGAISTALTGLLPGALSRLTKAAPGLEVFLAPGSSRDVYQQLISGLVDVAVIVEPPFAISKSLDWHRLRSEDLLLMVAADEPETDVRVLLENRPFIRYDRDNWGGRLADTFLIETGIAVRQRFELDSLEAIMVMVSQGLGVALMPDWARPWPADVAVRAIPVPGERYRRHIGLLHSRASHRLRRIELLRQAF